MAECLSLGGYDHQAARKRIFGHFGGQNKAGFPDKGLGMTPRCGVVNRWSLDLFCVHS